MKTIQQVLRRLDSEEIEKAYFHSHPITLFDINKKFDDITIGECKEMASARFQGFLNNLINMETEGSQEEPNILIIYKMNNDGISEVYEVGLTGLKDIGKVNDISKVQTYGYEYTRQREALGFFVADTKTTQDNIMDVVVDFLYNISFCGYDPITQEEEIKKLEESILEFGGKSEEKEAIDNDRMENKRFVLFQTIEEEIKKRKPSLSDEERYIIVAKFVNGFDFTNSALQHKSAGAWADMIISEL